MPSGVGEVVVVGGGGSEFVEDGGQRFECCGDRVGFAGAGEDGADVVAGLVLVPERVVDEPVDGFGQAGPGRGLVWPQGREDG
jgi:hypothetical protein